MFDLGIEKGNVYIDGTFQNCNIYIKDGKVAALSKERMEAKQTISAENQKVLPGFIDPHVHFALGVKTAITKDDFYTGSLEALHGGVTTVIDFVDPIKSISQLEEKYQSRQKLASKSLVDYAFHATIANPSDTAKDLIQAVKSYGMPSIKLFTTYSDTDRRTYDSYIYDLLSLSKEEKVKIVIHAENDELLWKKDKILIADLEHSRPVLSETSEVLKLALMAKETNGELYIVHVSAGSTVELLRKNFAKEMDEETIILESCPHYFLKTRDMLEGEDGYKYTMTPPLRNAKERELLKEQIRYITTIGTDHCPYTKEQKDKTYTNETCMGVGGIRYSFVNMYELFGDKIIDKFTKNPAHVYGLKGKGCILPGYDADIVLFDPKGTTVVSDEMSIYAKEEKKGKISMVLRRGEICVKEDVIQENIPQGTYIKR